MIFEKLAGSSSTEQSVLLYLDQTGAASEGSLKRIFGYPTNRAISGPALLAGRRSHSKGRR